MPDGDLAAVLRELAELRAIVERRPPRKPKDTRPLAICRVSRDEMAAIDAAAAARGLSRSDLIRTALAPVIGTVIATGRPIPPNFRKTLARKPRARDLTSAAISAATIERRTLQNADAAILASNATRDMAEPAPAFPVPISVPKASR